MTAISEPHNCYAIGQADRIGVIGRTGGIREVNFDLKQVSEEDTVKYNASLYGQPKGYEFEPIQNERVILQVAENVRDQLIGDALGWVVKDRHLGMFLHEMDEPVYRFR